MYGKDPLLKIRNEIQQLIFDHLSKPFNFNVINIHV